MPMRMFFTIILTVFCLLTAMAQDIIVKKDGDTLRVYDLKVNAKFITYRERPGKESPSKRIGKAKVLSVKKNKGKSIIISHPSPDTEIILDTTGQSENKMAEKPVAQHTVSAVDVPRKKEKGEIKRATSLENAQIVAAYNKKHSGYGNKKEKKRKAGCAVAIMGVTEGSVLANEDVEVEILQSETSNYASIQHNIFVKNRTEKIIYIDLEHSFRIFNDGTFKPYYSGKQIRRNKKNSSKITFSDKKTVSRPQYFGRERTTTSGTTFSLEDRTQTTQTVKEQRIIAIPPKGRIALPPHIYVDDHEEIICEYDTFSIKLPASRYLLHDWQVVNIDEQHTPYKNSFIITYSPNKNFSTYSTVKFVLYLKQLIGLGTRFSRFDTKLIHGYDRFTICGEAYIE